MAATLEAVPSTKTAEKKTEISEADAARELVRMAKEQGLSLTGPDGLLKQTDWPVNSPASISTTPINGWWASFSSGYKTGYNTMNGAVKSEADATCNSSRPTPSHSTAGSAAVSLLK